MRVFRDYLLLINDSRNAMLDEASFAGESIKQLSLQCVLISTVEVTLGFYDFGHELTHGLIGREEYSTMKTAGTDDLGAVVRTSFLHLLAVNCDYMYAL